MDCNICLSKYILCFFNFIVFIIGGAILGAGIWIYVEKDSFFDFIAPEGTQLTKELAMSDYVVYLSYFLMAIGALIFFLSLVGYCGAVVESRCLLVFYGVLLILILVLEITTGVLCYTHKDDVDKTVKSYLKETVTYYDPSINNDVNTESKMWDVLMLKMSCCGIDSYRDFENSPKFMDSHLKVPPACCKTNGTSMIDQDCPKFPKIENSYYLTGCYKTVLNHVFDYMNIVIYVLVGIVGVEILATFFAFCLCSSLSPVLDDYAK